jgi:cytochrome c-type biogenesis protein CcmH/NrfF
VLRVVIAVAVILFASNSSTASPYRQNRPSGETELRLMHNLACTCPTCNKEPIEECQCDFAAKMRGEVKEQLHGTDLTTAETRAAAYRSVRAAFAAKYGDAVLTPLPAVKTDPRLNWLPLVIFVGGLLVLANLTRRSIRRKREQKAARR